MHAPTRIRPFPIRSSPTASSQALEASGSVGGRSGWTPRHLVLKDPAQSIVACAPCYLKSHSQGEYVFDHSWADAYARAGGDYYPKLQIAVPFTPVPGRRLLVKPGTRCRGDRGAARRRPPSSSSSTAALSGLHVTFASEGEWERLGRARLPQAHRPAVPLEQRRLRHLRRFPGLARLTQAQGGAQGARGSASKRA